MLAALPMYFPPAGSVEAFWQVLAGVLRGALDSSAQAQVPAHLTWPQDYYAHWSRDCFLLSQTCGYPLTTVLHDQLQVVGAFAYDVEGAHGVLCRSQLICRNHDTRSTLADFQGATLAFNATDSQSGYNALRALVAQCSPPPRFSQAVATGSHGHAIESVRTGIADLAAIDCVSLDLWQRQHPALAAQIRVFADTAAYPGLPLVTHRTTPASTLAALRKSLAVVAAEARYAAVRAPLRIVGFAPMALADYAPCLEMRALALDRGVSVL